MKSFLHAVYIILIFIETLVVYSWNDSHSDKVKIPFPSASTESKLSFVGQVKDGS